MRHKLGSRPAGDASAQGYTSVPRLVFLVGFMGAGKSSVGRALARQLGWKFEDLDERIVAHEQRPIEQIFRDSGEAEFRRAEHLALRAVLSEADAEGRIVALGGGAFVQAENAALLAQASAMTVFLDAAAEVLFRRCLEEQQVERPLRKSEEEFRKLYLARRPHYLKASLRIETGDSDVDTVARQVASALGLPASDRFQGDVE